MLIEGNALKIRTIRSILVKSGDIGQNFRTLSFSERCFDTQTNIKITNNHAFRVALNAQLINENIDGLERCLILGHSMQTNERHYSYSDQRRLESIKKKLTSTN